MNASFYQDWYSLFPGIKYIKHPPSSSLAGREMEGEAELSVTSSSIQAKAQKSLTPVWIDLRVGKTCDREGVSRPIIERKTMANRHVRWSQVIPISAPSSAKKGIAIRFGDRLMNARLRRASGGRWRILCVSSSSRGSLRRPFSSPVVDGIAMHQEKSHTHPRLSDNNKDIKTTKPVATKPRSDL